MKWVVETIFKRLTSPGWVTELTNVARLQSTDSIHTEELDLSPQAAASVQQSPSGGLCAAPTQIQTLAASQGHSEDLLY